MNGRPGGWVCFGADLGREEMVSTASLPSLIGSRDEGWDGGGMRVCGWRRLPKNGRSAG
jgi:hypothetical protein